MLCRSGRWGSGTRGRTSGVVSVYTVYYQGWRRRWELTHEKPGLGEGMWG